jgi:hypothetical protein
MLIQRGGYIALSAGKTLISVMTPYKQTLGK